MTKRKIIKRIRKRKATKKTKESLKDKVADKTFEKPSPLVELLMKRMLGNSPQMYHQTPIPQMPMHTSENYNGEFKRMHKIIEENEQNSDINRILKKNKDVSDKNKELAEENMEINARIQAKQAPENNETMNQKIDLLKDTNTLNRQLNHNIVKERLLELKKTSIENIINDIKKINNNIVNLRDNVIAGKSKYSTPSFIRFNPVIKKYIEHKKDYNIAKDLFEHTNQLLQRHTDLDLDYRFYTNKRISIEHKIEQINDAYKKHARIYKHPGCDNCQAFENEINKQRSKLINVNTVIDDINKEQLQNDEKLSQSKNDFNIISDKYGGVESPKLFETISRWVNERGKNVEALLCNPNNVDLEKVENDKDLQENIDRLNYQIDLLKIYQDLEREKFNLHRNMNTQPQTTDEMISQV